MIKLADLPPDLRFPLLSRTPQDCDFAFVLKCEALRSSITQHWPWDESDQRAHHDMVFLQKLYHQIILRHETIGLFAVRRRLDYLQLSSFYFFQSQQNLGTGSRVLQHLLSQTRYLQLPMRVKCFAWSPARQFFTRHGFIELAQSDTHIFFERAWHLPVFSGV